MLLLESAQAGREHGHEEGEGLREGVAVMTGGLPIERARERVIRGGGAANGCGWLMIRGEGEGEEA